MKVNQVRTVNGVELRRNEEIGDHNRCEIIIIIIAQPPLHYLRGGFSLAVCWIGFFQVGQAVFADANLARCFQGAAAMAITSISETVVEIGTQIQPTDDHPKSLKSCEDEGSRCAGHRVFGPQSGAELATIKSNLVDEALSACTSQLLIRSKDLICLLPTLKWGSTGRIQIHDGTWEDAMV